MFDGLWRRLRGELDWSALEVEPTGSRDFGPCECCGNMSRTVWGFVHTPAATLAGYFVQWTLNNPAHGASFDLVVGRWGEHTSAQDRQGVSLEYRVVGGRGTFMVIDATPRGISDPSLVGAALRRDQVVGQPLAQQVFALADAIFMKDERLSEVRGWSREATWPG